jgi:hypothetical protein
MPKFLEIYGYSPNDASSAAIKAKKHACCPFTESPCDGGGNRHQTKIRLQGSWLRNYFDSSLESVVPGVCSIDYGQEKWIVCPRRLLGFSGAPNLAINHALQVHERQALIRAGLPQGVELGIWSEVHLKYEEGSLLSINYHFDFVISPILRNKSISDLLKDYSPHNEVIISELLKSAKKGKYGSGRLRLETTIPILPNLTNPTIIEVMTASTSGSNTEAGTDIASAFSNAILGKAHDCPGINKRQVWGRMATQLFSKSALAEAWGGRTIWLVQDQLLKDIQRTTKLNLSDINDSNSGAICFLSMTYKEGEIGINSLRVAEFSSKAAGLSFNGSGKCSDIFLPKSNPNKIELLISVLRRELSAIIVL